MRYGRECSHAELESASLNLEVQSKQSGSEAAPEDKARSSSFLGFLTDLMRSLKGAQSDSDIETSIIKNLMSPFGISSAALLWLSDDRARISYSQISSDNTASKTCSGVSDYSRVRIDLSSLPQTRNTCNLYTDCASFERDYPEFADAAHVALPESQRDARFLIAAPMNSDLGQRGVLCLPTNTCTQITEDEASFIDCAADLIANTVSRLRLQSSGGNSGVQDSVQLDDARANAHIGTWSLNLITLEIHWSPEIFQITGFDSANGIPPYEEFEARIHPEDKPDRDAAVWRFERDGVPVQFTMRYYHPSRGYRWIVSSFRNEWDVNGRAIRRVGTITDVTALKLAEEEHARLNAIVELGSDYVVTFTVDGEILYANQSLCAFLGKTFEEVKSLSMRDVIAPSSWKFECQSESIAATIRDGSYECESVYLSESGIETPVSLHLVAHQDSLGHAYLSGIARDIGEQLKAQNDLKKMAQMLEEAQEVASLGCWERDTITGEAYWSKEMYQLLQFDPACGVPPLNLISSRYPQGELLIRTFAGPPDDQQPTTVSSDSKICLPDHSERWVHRKARAEFNGEGEIVRIHGTVMDITERKRAELELERLYHIIEASSDLVTISRIDGTLLYLNAAFRERFGSLEVHTRMDDFFRMYTPESIKRVTDEARPQALKTGKWSGELDVVAPDGALVSLFSQSFIHRDSNGQPLFRFTVSRDITVEKKAKQEQLWLTEQMHLAQEVASLGSWVRDLRSGEFYMSPELYRLLAFDPTEPKPTQEQISARYHGAPLNWDLVLNDYALTGITQREVETLAHLPDGTERWLLRKARIILNEKGEPDRILGTTQDITAQTIARMELERLRMIMEAASDMVLTFGMEGQVLYCNESCRSVMGWRSDLELADDLRTNLTVGSLDIIDNVGMHVMRATGAWSGELDLIAADGSVVNCYAQMIMHADKAGNGLFWSVLCHDITRHKTLEALQRLATDRLDAAQRVAGMGSWELTVETGQLWFSTNFLTLIGRADSKPPSSLDELCGLYDEEEANRLQRAIAAALENGTEYELTLHSKRPSGAPAYYRETGMAVKGSTGKVERLIHICTDVTRVENLEQQLQQSQKMDSIGRLAGAIAHDFNNLLSVIIGHAELLEDTVGDDADSISSIKNILNAADTGANLTKQLLAFARKQHTTPAVVNPNSLILGMTNMLGPLMGRTTHVVTKLVADVWHVKFDQGQFEQVIVNLLVNARDAMPPHGGTVLLETINVRIPARPGSLIPEGEYVRINVMDDGVGMPAEVQDRIFEPFFTTKDKGKGTGLGLATVYGIVLQNKAYIQVDSAPGKGTRFKIHIPRADSKAVV